MYWFIMAPYENRHFLELRHLLSLRGKDPCLRSPDNKCTSGDLGTGMWQSSWRSNGVKCCIEKNNRKGRWERWVFASFVFSFFFPFFHFHLSICPKSQGKPKRNKKNNPVRRIWSKSIPDFFCFFGFPRFSRGFWCPKPQLSKNSRKTKKNKKNNPVRRILSKSIQDCFFLFFLVYLVFLEVFWCPKPQLSKNSRKTKKNKKNNPVRRILGKSIQDCFFCFFWFIWFFSRFFGVPSPNCPKTRGKPKKQKKQSCEKNLG